MSALYGVLAAMPVIWGCAGYVLVSHPGTEEIDSRGRQKHRRG
jgi:hypothetical protein